MATAAAVAAVQGHYSSPFDLDNTTTMRYQLCDDVINATWRPTSVSIKLHPVGELRATVSERRQIIVDVAPPHGQRTHCDNTTANGRPTVNEIPW